MAVLSSHAMCCSVCQGQGEYFSKTDWLQHLSSDGHQVLARKECLEKWDKWSGRKCSLVIFSSFPLTRGEDGGADKIVRFLSMDPVTFVTDFVWWEDRPHIGFVQFESREKAMEILLPLQDSAWSFLIDNQRVQARWALDLLELEWNGILPSGAVRAGDEAKLKAAQFCLEKLGEDNKVQVAKKKRALKPEGNKEEEGSSRDFKKLKIDPGTAAPEFDQRQLLASVLGSCDSLQYQFWNVGKSVTIPDDEYDKAVEVTRSLRALFLRTDPTAEVVMFRNWYLKLRNPALDSDLLFYIYNARSQPAHPDSFTWLPNLTVLQVFRMAAAQQHFTVVETLNEIGWKIKFKPSNMDFHLVTCKPFFVEAQMCRLYKYMCSFDPRCHPLLTLAYYWSWKNSLFIGKRTVSPWIMHNTLPEPVTLEWLVMWFLCHRGIVPTPREIQGRPHDPLTDRIFGIDMGFHADPQFAHEWIGRRRAIDPTIPKDDDQSSEEFILSVLNLFQEFLHFCWETVGCGQWILNTRDGELIRTERFLACEPNGTNAKSSGGWTTKMSELELSLLRALQHHTEMENGNREETENRRFPCRINFKNWKLYMIHPFVFQRNFSVSKDVEHTLKMMGATGYILRTFLNVRRWKGLAEAMKRFGSLENVLKVPA